MLEVISMVAKVVFTGVACISIIALGYAILEFILDFIFG